jgi:DNA-binding transcriptional ArsR family regulator
MRKEMLMVSPKGATNVRGVAAAKKLLPRVDELDAMEVFFKVLGDSTRLRILHALLAGELNVGDLSETLSMSLSAVSHQLSVLKSARLVRHRREGKQVHYSLSDDHITSMLDSMRTHLAEGTVRP